ncbi:AraC family transcriptional regulator [Lysobacter panacisoli]|uniref:AraC family transcriptional regulator n=1 Tax=Lysobacter panacisoli TaxID=1255263 RepID=A0ABP9LD77_9GAMM|nr:AraC family transcriptional regulator [Lysobacter panacisoli]
MNRSQTFDSYSTRIGKVVAFMSTRLDQPLTLAQLAQVGHFSPWHFHRIYRGQMGETVTGTLRRLRLHRAANELLTGTRSIAEIARRAGYGSAAAFTRAFGSTYRCTPAAFRQRRASPSTRHDGAIPLTEDEIRMYTARITTLPPVRVAALAHRGDYKAIGGTFDRLMAWAGRNGLLGPQARSFGVYYDAPSEVPAEQLRSDACLLVPADAPLDEGMRWIEIAGGRHAVVVHTGPYAELERAYDWLFSHWLPNSFEEAGDAPVFEEYLNDPSTLPPAQWQTAICLPLK